MAILHNDQRLWFLVAVAALALPFFLFALYAIDELARSERDRASAQLLQGAQLTANAVNQQLAVSVGYLTSLASSDAARRDDLPALYAHAQRIMQVLPEANAISLVAEDDSIVFLTLRPLGTQGLVTPEIDAADAVFKTGKAVVSGPFKSPISDKIITSVGIPVMRDGKVIYCLRMILLTSALNDLLLAQKLPEDWTSGIIAANGKLVARSRAPERFVGKLASAEIRDAMRSGTQAILDTQTLEGTPVKAIVVKLPLWDWSIAIGVPVDKLNLSRDRAYRLLAMFGVAVAVLGALASYWLQPRVIARSISPSVAVDLPLRTVKGIWPAVAALAIAIVLSVATSVATQSSLTGIQQRVDQRSAADTLHTQIVELLSLFKDLETGQRGFVITGREAYLEPYNVAVEKIPLSIAALKSGLAAGQIEGFSWAELDGLTRARQVLAARAIAERRALGFDVLKDQNLFDEGKLAMDKIRLRLQSLEGLLTRRVEWLTAHLRDEREKATQMQWISALAAGVLVCFSIVFWLQERQRRKHLYAELESSHATLESRVVERTAQLRLAGERIRNFSAESERNIEAERKRLSREVHDQIGQVFTGIKMILKTLRPGSLARDQQEALTAAIDTGVQTTQRIAAELRPPLLDELGLRAAVDYYLRVHAGPTGLSYDVDIPDDNGLNSEQMTQLFRVVQEATTNVVRHAHASHITVSGARLGATWEMHVDDDGTGFDAAHVRDGALGLLGIQERAQMLGGQASIERQPAGGTRVSIRIPVSHLNTRT
ncbi:MAG: CHASE3 domain-containing protein [Burkholderiales bacterium]|nr:CHASE3 domain-containing protein [Burkholderiales bacterium]